MLKHSEVYCSVNSISDCYSSNKLLEEIKKRIKTYYGSQDKFAHEFGYSRKALNRLLNHSCDFSEIIRMCKLLKINGIRID